MNIPETVHPRIVVIGGGFAGLELIKSLKNKKLQVILLDKNNFHTFQPLLYQVATAGLEPDSIAFPIRKILKKHKNCFFRNTEVKRIDPEKYTVETTLGSLKYDHLVIATGSAANFFGNEKVKQNSMPMYNLSESLNLRTRILGSLEKAIVEESPERRQALMNFAIVGGGPTGVELAGALAELKKHVLQSDFPELDLKEMNIYLLEGADRVLPPMAEISSRKAEEFLEKLGVEVRLGTMVEEYDGKTVKTNKQDFDAETLIWTAGVKGSGLAGIEKAEVEKTGRLLVDEFNCIKGHKDIYAVGDVALMETEAYPKGHPMLAPVAMQQGEHLGLNISRMTEGKKPIPFRYKNGGTMATVGRNKAVVELPKYKTQGMLAWFIWMGVHLYSLIGTRNKMVTFINWVWNYFNYDRGERIIIDTSKPSPK